MSQAHDKHEFTVVETVDDGVRYIALSIESSDDRAQDYFKAVWQKMSNVVKGFHDLCRDGACPAWTRWQPYNWSKQTVPEREKFVAWDGDVLVGLINLRPNYTSAYASGEPKPITYVEHVAASPGCQSTRIWRRSYGRVGVALLAFAIKQSVLRNQKGLIGLHSAGSDSTEWYEKLNTEYGGGLFHPQKMEVPGAHEADRERPYFETTETGAASLLESYVHE